MNLKGRKNNIHKSLLFVLIGLLSACGNKIDLRDTSFELKNNLGIISLSVPATWNTYTTCFDSSDIPYDDKYGFYFTKTSYICDSGLYGNFKNAGQYLRISQYERLNSPSNLVQLSILTREEIDFWKENAEGHSTYVYNDFWEINGREYAVLGMQGAYNGKPKGHLHAKTKVGDQLIMIEYNCYAEDCENFVHQMKSSLKSIIITSDDK